VSAVAQTLPYCGAAPLPGELLVRFNLDPLLLTALVALLLLHVWRGRSHQQRLYALSGWLVAAAALVSPLCALSVALFSARVAQHMILILVAAPLLALALPITSPRPAPWRLWAAAGAFLLALWFWHMPVPYDATFASTIIYWTMHVTLSGSALMLWRELLQRAVTRAPDVLAAGIVSSMQMGLLGAVLTFAGRPLFFWHLATTQVWGLTPLQDQQLGGVFMWVPGIALFLWAALRAISRLRSSLEQDLGRT
jgi:putative membrane protein